jgi:AcrR family transcriptional regulator
MTDPTASDPSAAPATSTAPARRTRRIGRRREDVLDAACEVVADRGAEATRFSDIAEATGVGVSTLQYWFGSREDMLVTVFRHAADRDLAAAAAHLDTEPSPWRRLVHLAAYLTGSTDEGDNPAPGGGDLGWRLWIEWWHWALRDLEVRAEVLHDYSRWRQLIADTITAGRNAGAFDIDRPPMEIAHQVLAFLDGLALPTALGDPAITPVHARDLLTDALARFVGHHSEH